MLEKMRDGSQGLLAKFVVGAIILSFALFGIGNYISSPSQTSAAEVNGQPISLQELDRAYQQQRSRLQQQLGQAFNQYASSPEFIEKIKKDALQSLISRTLLEQKAAQLGLRVGDEQLKAEIKKTAMFQVDGEFSNERFLSLLGQNRINAEQYSNDVRQGLIITQLQAAFGDTDFGLPYEAAEVKRLRDQKREMQFVAISADKFKASIEASDEQIQAHYEQSKAQYQIPETVSIEYIELNLESLKAEFTISDTDIKAHYEANTAQYTVPKKQNIAQIQVNIDDDETAAKSKAEAALAKLNAGDDFAAVAKTDSQDLFSAANGGKLVAYNPGTVEASFSSAVDALEVGQLSTLVKTKNAFHIIKLLSAESERMKSLVEVKDEIAAQLKLEKASDSFVSSQNELASLAFELKDSLSEVATELKLELKTAKDFSRATAPTLLRNPKVLAVAFDPEMIDKAENSEIIELSPESLIVVRVINHTPSLTQPLADVKEQVKSNYISAQAKLAADTYASELVVSLEKADASAEKLAEYQLTMSDLKTIGRYESDLDSSIAQAVFAMPKPDKAISVKKIQQRNGDLAVIKLSKVVPGDISEIKDSIGMDQIANEQSNASVNAMLALLTEQAEIKYFKLAN